MPVVYILISLRDNKRCIGSTLDLERRFHEHMQGLVQSTKHRRPLKLFAWRAFETIEEAATWEKKYKRSHDQLERDINSKKLMMNHSDFLRGLA